MLKIVLVLFILVNLIWIASQNSLTKNLIANFQTQAQVTPSVTPFPTTEIPIFIPDPSPSVTPVPSPQIALKQPSSHELLKDQKYIYQTYNNCGPATLSMLLDFYSINVSQQEIADLIRPYNNPAGYNDDKSVTLDEMATYAVSRGLTTFKRPNGDIEKLKLLISNGIPVVTITWIDQKGGFGHYRIVKGYDEAKKQIIQDDTIFGQGQAVSYDEFMRLWQVFNYDYLVIVPQDKVTVAESILGSELSEKTAFENALKRAENETGIYSVFNQAISHYYLNHFDQTIRLFESVQTKLPYRIAWYQIEPIIAYQKLGRFDEVFKLTEHIFRSGNPSAAELYQIRGEIYLEQNKKPEARKEFEQALLYQKNSEAIKHALLKI